MLRFLRKRLASIRKRHRFLLKLVSLSAGLHCLVLIIVLISMYFFKKDKFYVDAKALRNDHGINFIVMHTSRTNNHSDDVGCKE